MKQSHQSQVFALSIISAAILSACGGGSGGEGGAADTNAYVQGTAAYGAAMAKASISREGALAEPRISKSDPGVTRPKISSRFPATVISLTG